MVISTLLTVLSREVLRYSNGPPAPLQTELSCCCEMNYLIVKETHNKNEENTLKELNEIFLIVYGMLK